MPIWIDIANLVVAKEALRTKYPGGFERFRSDLRFDPLNKADQEDDELVSFGALEVESVFGRLQALRTAGLRYDETQPAENDMVLVQRYGGATNRPTWLRINSFYVWHAACAPHLQELVTGIVKLDVDEFIARRERGEIPVGTIR
ncbi:MAG TPA: hypothetical protein PKJ19_12155 [Flavobacteriales bacterium]|nr:hypothetical protein [Flavobacteriales bacterium]HNU56952.1 hypothetical protein [Flavobacteriales bacterium]